MVTAVVLGPADDLTAAIAASLSESRLAGSCEVSRSAESLARALSAVILRPSLRGSHQPVPDLDAATATLERVAEAAPAHVVLLSSAAIYPPRHDHPGLIAEPAAPPPSRNPIAAAWAAFEELAARELAGLKLTILRPVTVLSRDNPELLARLLLGRFAVPSAGYDPSIQVLSAEDLAAGVRSAVERSPGGVFHLAPDGALPLRRALRLAGVARLPLPHTWRRIARAAGFPLGLAGAPAAAEGLRYPATVGNAKAKRELGFAPRQRSEEAILAAARSKHGARAPEAAAVAESDPFGLDAGYVRRYQRTLFRFLRRVWWRIEVQGIEHVPRQGQAVLTGVHRGFMPYDGVMALDLVEEATGRIPRFLIHPCLVKPPFLSDFMTKLGGIVACQENADWVLEREGLLGFFPEGIRGAFTYYRDAYKLGKLGRDEYVKAALRNRAPILPFVTVGSAEIFPVLAKIRWAAWERFTEWPCFPVAPPFPLLPVPLPSKWHTQFLPPIHVEERHGPEAADDPAVVAALSAEVRRVIEAAMAEMLARRRHVFWGNIFEVKAKPRPLAGERRKEATL